MPSIQGLYCSIACGHLLSYREGSNDGWCMPVTMDSSMVLQCQASSAIYRHPSTRVIPAECPGPALLQGPRHEHKICPSFSRLAECAQGQQVQLSCANLSCMLEILDLIAHSEEGPLTCIPDGTGEYVWGAARSEGTNKVHAMSSWILITRGVSMRGAGVVSGGGVSRHSHGQEAWEVFGGGVCGAARRPTFGLRAPEKPLLHGQALRGGLQSQEDGEPPLLDEHDRNDCMHTWRHQVNTPERQQI